MKSWMKGILTLVLALAVVGGSASQSFAVFGDGAGDGGRFVKRGKPMAGVKVTITQTNPNGTKTQTESETDDRGFFFLPPTGDSVTQIRFTEKDGTVSTFSGPFHDLDAVRPLGMAGSGINPQAEILRFDFLASDEEGGFPNIANIGREEEQSSGIPNIGNGFGGSNGMYPWRVQNPAGRFGTIGAALGGHIVNKDFSLDKRMVTFTDFDSNGVPTAGADPVSRDFRDGFDPNLTVQKGFAEIFVNVGSLRFSKYRLDNALNVKVGAGRVNYEENRDLSSSNTSLSSNSVSANEQTEFSGTHPAVGLGGSHIFYAPVSPLYVGFIWDMFWIPSISVEDSPLLSGTSNGAGNVLSRKTDLSYQDLSVGGRTGWVFNNSLAGFLGVGGSWSWLDVDTVLRTEQGVNTRKEEISRELSGGGVYGEAGLDFHVPNTRFFGRVQSRFNADGFDLMFKTAIPDLYVF